MSEAKKWRLTVDALAMTTPATGVPTVIAEILRALQTHAPEVELRTFGPVKNMPRVLRIAFEQLLLPLFLRRTDVLLAPAYVMPIWAPCDTWLVIHDLHVFTHPETCSRLNRWHYRWLMPPSLQRAKRIFVLSQHVHDLLVARFPETANKVAILPVGVPHDMTHVNDAKTREAFRARWQLPEKFFLFVGGLHPRKNVARLLAAMSKLPDDARLVMAGANGTAHPKVRWLGRVPQADMACLYSCAHALVMPSLDEGFGFPVLEAAACHCPVIATPGPAREFFSEALMCDPLSVDSIAAAMLRLWQDPELCHALSQKAAQHAERFSWYNTARMLKAFLAS